MIIREIESRENARLKLARKTRDGKEPSLIFVEGTRLAEEAVRSDLEIVLCLYQNDYLEDERNSTLVRSIQRKTDESFELNEKLFCSISDTSSPQGVILVCRRPATDLSAFNKALSDQRTSMSLIVLLSEINNPANLGAVIRTVEASGSAGVVVSKRSADVFSPRSLRGSMGSAFRIPIWAGAEFDEVLEWARSRQLRTIGTRADADRTYTDVDWTAKHLLVMGSEAHGISEKIEKKLDENIRIPMDENVESLNLAVAAGIVLFEARRQVTLQTNAKGSRTESSHLKNPN